MYKKVSTNLNFVDREKETEKFWDDNHIFEKSMENRKEGPTYTFYDGPPTANGKPHIGHVLTRVIKDMIPRYRTMKGYMVPRKAGWDTHGLPVELEVEKLLGLNGKEQIEEYGMEPFIKKCKESVWKYKGMWEDFSGTVGFWADMENPYVTYDDNFIESEWWALKTIWDKKLLYKGFKIVPYCPRCGTGLASHEVAQGYKEVKNNGEECIVACQDMGIQDWKLVGVFSMDDITSLAPYYSTIIAIIMGINIIFVFLCSTLLTYLIFKPLRKIENHMQIVENGEFITMPVDDYDNEITNLRKVFNHMILSVKALMKRVKDEERIIAKGKLDIIYAQINPHFLYNTLDAISALALMEENEKCFQMIQALGNFYKNSLNSGLDYISVEDEIDCIESYITILNTRYENQIAISYDIEDVVKHEKVLKLLLQPLVENAVHHGLNGEGGNIEIKVFEQEDEIIFIVSDDGVGMSDEKIEDILAGRTVTGKSGFGLYSLIQRIRLTYGIENPVIIQSEVGVGTEIIVTIKKIKMEK